MKTSSIIVLCNSAQPPKGSNKKSIVLNYLPHKKNKPNVVIGLPILVQAVYHLPKRILDLLEIACYVFAADRYTSRGAVDAVEYHGWAREFEFVIKVRDYEFWNDEVTKNMLGELLTFMTGDQSFVFEFQKGHDTPPSSLFDREEFQISSGEPTHISLFSGGLDSLVGAVELLEATIDKICLVSHQSGQPGTIRTQDALSRALNQLYPGRLRHYKFRSGLTEKRAIEETQRSRSFLYCSIAYALTSAYKQNYFYVFENGITSLNLPRKEDLKNGRASRTTHPKTIALLKSFLSHVEGRPIDIRTPFLWRTKTDILDGLKSSRAKDLLTSSVSCSRTSQPFVRGTHCGVCYQCIDRRFAVHASGLDDADNPALYNCDFIRESIPDTESKSMLFGYVRQAKEFSESRLDPFFKEYLPQLAEIIDYVEGHDDSTKVERIWDLCKRYGVQVWEATEVMRRKYDDPRKPLAFGSYLKIINEREHLKEPVHRLIGDLSKKLQRAIPVAYQRTKPKNENKLNDTIQSILLSEKDYFEREYPGVSFALCKTIPDHSSTSHELLLEAKFPRKSTGIAQLTDQLGADLYKYPQQCKILFVIYDPYRKIIDDVKFAADIQNRDPRCAVLCVR